MRSHRDLPPVILLQVVVFTSSWSGPVNIYEVDVQLCFCPEWLFPPQHNLRGSPPVAHSCAPMCTRADAWMCLWRLCSGCERLPRHPKWQVSVLVYSQLPQGLTGVFLSFSV